MSTLIDHNVNAVAPPPFMVTDPRWAAARASLLCPLRASFQEPRRSFLSAR